MEEIYRSQFRMPQSLYELLKASADNNRRSVNAELISRLESSFSKDERMRRNLHSLMEEPVGHVDAEAAPLNIIEQDEAAAAPSNTVHGVSKEKLLSTLEEDKPVTKRDLDTAVMEALMKALDRLDTRIGDRFQDQPTRGPAPRKKYPNQ
ncbi:Arc family DNA-binding protein [Pseudomonas asturiensis]|uniref:Arc family DNA-binding protein n=1 Tax=Pseudomonas asturiensis TaxID=1190415 RepID=A0ABX6HD77_9PSED|nr:Arc family DNA-binding protein [Pseudomonas asturiensis]QHF03343.1 Arc family DNA-binding protein [Pseudomonas asturiensis]